MTSIESAREYAKDQMQHYKSFDLMSSPKEWIPISRIKYRSSWDWLMPVVEKIEKTKGDRNTYRFTMGIEPDGTTYCFINEGASVRISWGESATSKIEAVFIAVGDFCLIQIKE